MKAFVRTLVDISEEALQLVVENILVGTENHQTYFQTNPEYQLEM